MGILHVPDILGQAGTGRNRQEQAGTGRNRQDACPTALNIHPQISATPNFLVRKEKEVN